MKRPPQVLKQKKRINDNTKKSAICKQKTNLTVGRWTFSKGKYKIHFQIVYNSGKNNNRKANTNKKMILQIKNNLTIMTNDKADTNKKMILQINKNILAIMTIDEADTNRKHCHSK